MERVLLQWLRLPRTVCTVSLHVLGLSGLNQPQMENVWEKKVQKIPKAKLGAGRSNYLRSIYTVINNCLHNIFIVLGIASDLELTYSIRKDRVGYNENAAPFHVRGEGIRRS